MLNASFPVSDILLGTDINYSCFDIIIINKYNLIWLKIAVDIYMENVNYKKIYENMHIVAI